MGKGVERQDRGGRKGALKRVSEVSKDSLTRDGRGWNSSVKVCHTLVPGPTCQALGHGVSVTQQPDEAESIISSHLTDEKSKAAQVWNFHITH